MKYLFSGIRGGHRVRVGASVRGLGSARKRDRFYPGPSKRTDLKQ